MPEDVQYYEIFSIFQFAQSKAVRNALVSFRHVTSHNWLSSQHLNIHSELVFNTAATRIGDALTFYYFLYACCEENIFGQTAFSLIIQKKGEKK